jgi:hypothetical protein
MIKDIITYRKAKNLPDRDFAFVKNAVVSGTLVVTEDGKGYAALEK